MASLSKKFLQASENGISYDCEFIVGSEKIVIKGHKFLFSVASDVFKAMFYGELKEDHPIKIEELDADGFKSLKHFVYTGEVNFTSALHALSTYIAARKYLMTELIKECRKYIQNNIKPSEVLEFYEYCEMNNIPDFEELCLKIIEEKTDVVVKSEYFPTVKIETVQLILKSRSLKLKSEIEVFDIFEKWALAEAARQQISEGDLASSFLNLKKCIRFLTITSDEFSSRIEHSLLLTDAEKRAIKCNLQELDSKPIPENLSMIQLERNFLPTQSKFDDNFQKSHIFLVILSHPYNTGYLNFDETLRVHLVVNARNFKMNDVDYLGIFVKVCDQDKQHEGVFKILTKVSVLAVNENENLIFTNERQTFKGDSNRDSRITNLDDGQILAARISYDQLVGNLLLDSGRTQERTVSIRVQANVINLEDDK